MAPPQSPNTERMPEFSLPADAARVIRDAAASASTSVAEFTRRAVLRQLAVHEPSPYSFSGHGPSLLRDTFVLGHQGPPVSSEQREAARWRLDKFRTQQQDPNRVVEFAVNTGNASAVVAPADSASPFLGVPTADRPLVAAAERLPLLNGSAPFSVPGDVIATAATADHVEGVNPSEGTIAAAIQPVSPTGISGTYKMTREIYDSSNPAIDAIALAAMRESYAQQTEARAYAELNGTSGQAGTITSGLVPSGAQVRTAAVATAPTDLRTKLRQSLAEYAFVRKVKPRASMLSLEAATALADLLDASTGDLLAMWRELGVGINPAPAMTGNAAGDADVLTLGPASLWAWESPTLTFEYKERSGPAFVEVSLYGYFAVRLLRPSGLSAIRYTA